MKQFSYFIEKMEAGYHIKNGASSKNLSNRGNIFRTAYFLCCLIACIVLSGCDIFGGEDEYEEIESWMSEVFIGVWEKDNSGGSVLIDFTADAWTASYEGATYNSGTYEVNKITESAITANLKVTNKGIGSANVGSTGSAVLTLGSNKIAVSGFSDANMNGQYSNPDLSLVSSLFDGTLTGTAENISGNDSIYSRVMATLVPPDYDDSRWIVAQGTYANGAFSITLPATPPTLLLNKITDFFAGQQVFGYINKVSDENAQICAVDEIAAATKVNEDGSFSKRNLYYGKIDNLAQTTVIFVYCDRDVSIVESNQFQTTSVMLKKGWNKIYRTQPFNSQKSTVSTKEMEDLKWFF